MTATRRRLDVMKTLAGASIRPRLLERVRTMAHQSGWLAETNRASREPLVHHFAMPDTGNDLRRSDAAVVLLDDEASTPLAGLLVGNSDAGAPAPSPFIRHPRPTAKWQKSAQPEMPNALQAAVVEQCLVRKDDTTCWGRVSHTALTDLRGEDTGAPAIMSDITASKAQEVELRASEDFLAALTNSMAEGMFAMGSDGSVTYMNQAAERLLGWTKDELTSRSMHDMTHYQRDDASPYPAAECPLLSVLHTGTTVRIEDDAFTRRDGRLLPVVYSAAPITFDGAVLGVVVVFSDVSARKAEEERREGELETLNWVGRIRDAIDEDRFVLHAQPIIELHSRKVVTHELLLRLVDRDGAIVEPRRFLPAAEQFGLIEEIDRWVLAEAVTLAAVGLKVHFNISGKSLGSGALMSALVSALRDTGADPAMLVCEITETALAKDEAVAKAFVHELAQLGCGIALDDFGTGYGGFAYLKSLPVTVLKIDLEFVRDLPENSENQHVVKAIVTLARGFGRETIAEGVESEATLALLEDYGVDYAQGFAIGPTRPIDTLLTGDLIPVPIGVSSLPPAAAGRK